MLSKFIFKQAGRAQALMPAHLARVSATALPTSVNSANFMTLNKSGQRQFKIDAVRFFSSSSSSSEDDSDASSAEESEQEEGSKQEYVRKNNNKGARTGNMNDVNILEIKEKCENGELEGMNEYHLMVYLQKVIRAQTTQREVPFHERGEQLDALNTYLQARLEKDENPIYLHEIGDYLMLAQNKTRFQANHLRTVFVKKVEEVFGQEADQMRQEFKDMSLFRIAQIVRAMPNDRRSTVVLDFATQVLKQEDEPKPIVALFRLLEFVTDSSTFINRTHKTQEELIKVFSDPNQVDLANINVRMRGLVLAKLTNIVKQIGGPAQVRKECENLMDQLIDSINGDISSLEERAVIDLMNTLSTIIGTESKLSRKSVELSRRVHNVVTDMAVENQDLVDSNFIMDYLRATASMGNRLDRDKTEAFVEMFRQKCGEEGTQQYIRDHLQNSLMAIEVDKKHNLPELKDLILEKWTDGKRNFQFYNESYNYCKRLINQKKKEGKWDDESEAYFNEKTLENISNINTANKIRQPARVIPDKLALLSIAEQLPESEQRDELITEIVEKLNGYNVDTGGFGMRRQLLTNLISMLESEATIGPKGREIVTRVFEELTSSSMPAEGEAAKDLDLLLDLEESLIRAPYGDQHLTSAYKAFVNTRLENQTTRSNQVETLINKIYISFHEVSMKQGLGQAFNYLQKSLLQVRTRYTPQPEDRRLQSKIYQLITKGMDHRHKNRQNWQNLASESTWMLNSMNAESQVPNNAMQVNSILRRAYQTQTFFGRNFNYTENPVRAIFESEEFVQKFPRTVLQLADDYGERKLRPSSKEAIRQIFNDEENLASNMTVQARSDALRLVNQAKLNNFYQRSAKTLGGIKCTLENEEVADSFKKALIALQTKDQRRYESQHDHITQLLMIGKLDNQPLNESKALIKETLDTIYDDIIPPNRLIERILEAFRVRKFQKDVSAGRLMSREVLLHSSHYLKERIETIDMKRDEFIALIEMFAQEEWSNHETYNNFIKGFGEDFDKFSSEHCVTFIQKLVQAGLNQVDILDAVIDKVNTDNSRSSVHVKRKQIVNLISTAFQADGAQSETFEKFMAMENLDQKFSSQGGAQKHLKDSLRFQFDANENISLLQSIIARSDLSQDSAVKDFGAIVLDVVNDKIGKPNAGKRLNNKTKNDLAAIDHLFNEHPNREAIFGSNFSLNLSDDLRNELRTRIPEGANLTRGSDVVKALERMGYEGVDSSNAQFHSVHSYLNLADQQQHVVVERNPYMFDNETLRPNVAFAVKAISALDDGSSSIVLPLQNVRSTERRGADAMTSYLNSKGIQTLKEQEVAGEPASTPEETTTTGSEDAASDEVKQ